MNFHKKLNIKESPLSIKIRVKIGWNSDIRTKNNYGAAKELAWIMGVNQGGESPVYLV
jgi:hypothetical protein